MSLLLVYGGVTTTSDFAKTAIDYYASNVPPKVILMDAVRLADLMIKHEAGVSTPNRSNSMSLISTLLLHQIPK